MRKRSQFFWVTKKNNWNEKFMRGTQQEIWSQRRISEIKDRSIEVSQS